MARWGPLALSVLGALLVLACFTVFASTPWSPELRTAEIVAAVGVVVAAAISALSMWGVRRRALDALEPMLAAFPIGVAAAMGGLKESLGVFFSVRAVVFGGALLVASVLWRRSRERAKPGWVVVGVVVLGSLALFLSPGAQWWGDTTGTDLLRWPLTACLGLAAVLATVGVAVGRANGGAAWAVLAAAAGGTALAAAFAVGDFMDYEDYTPQAGWVMAMLGGLLLTVATVVVLWGAYAPNSVGSARRSSRSQ